MATIKQKAVIQNLTENNRTKGELLEKAGYSKSMQEQPSRVLESKGIKGLIELGESMGLDDKTCLQTVIDCVKSNQLGNALNAVKYWFQIKYPESKEYGAQVNVQVNNIVPTHEMKKETIMEYIFKSFSDEEKSQLKEKL